MNNTLARVRIKDFANTATIAAQDDYLALDGETNGTRRISSEAYLKPLTLRVDALEGVGGNLNAYDFGTGNPTQEQLTVYAIGQIWPNYTDLSYNADNPAASTFNDAQGNPHSAAEIFNATRVKNLNNDDIYMLTNTQDTTPAVFDWANVGQEASQNLKQLGEIYFSLSNLTKYNPGAILINAPQTLTKAAANYSNLVQFVQDNPAINKTPAEWQSYYTQYGQCPYFALTEDGEGDYNLQLPVVKEYIKAVNPADGTPAIKAALAGLPNITWDLSEILSVSELIASGALQVESIERRSQTMADVINQPRWSLNMNAARSSSVYGSSDTVTPAHITLYPWLYVFYSDNNPGNTPIPFELLPATSERLGGIKVGSGLSVTDDGTLSASVSATKDLVDLGTVSTSTFETNKNYAAKINGSVSFTLPTVTDTSIENAIKLNLEVLGASQINWGVNANAVLSSFAVGKYEIRLRFNNNTSLWTAEVLKEQTVASDSPMKMLFHFDGNYTNAVDNGLSLTPYTNYSPTYSAGKFGQAVQVLGNFSGPAAAFSLPGNDILNIPPSTSFTIQFWGKTGPQDNFGISALADQIAGNTPSNEVTFNGRLVVGGNRLGTTDGANNPEAYTWTHHAYTYDATTANYRYFQNGIKKWETALTGKTLSLSGCALINPRTYNTDLSVVEMDELRVDIGACLYVDNFTLPTAPFAVEAEILADVTPIVPIATADSVGGIKLSYDETTSTLNIVTE